MTVGSPFDLTLAIQGGAAGITVYAIHLLARAPRDPSQVGAWLPRLIAGLHTGMRESDEAAALREALGSTRAAGNLLEEIQLLEELGPAGRISTDGAGPVPSELEDVGDAERNAP